MVSHGIFLHRLPWNREEKGMAPFLTVPCGDGYALGDLPTSYRNHKPLDATVGVLGQDWNAFLDRCCVWLSLYGHAVHRVCTYWDVC